MCDRAVSKFAGLSVLGVLTKMAVLCRMRDVLMKCSFAVLLLSCCVMPVLAQDSQEPVGVPEEAMQKLRTVKPVLSAESGMRMQGTVVLNAIVNKSGGIESLQTVSGPPTLVPAALEAVRQWRYRPYEVNGIPRVVGTTIRVEFPDVGDEKSEASAPPEESPVLANAEDIRERLVYKIAPVYPPLARQARIQGTVVLRIFINKLGEVRDVELVSGHPMLAPAAGEAVKKWRYMPYESGGKAVEIQTEVQVIFRMAGA